MAMAMAMAEAISLDGVCDKNVMQLRKLNAVLFPVRYNDKCYADAIASADFTKLAYFSDVCVCSIARRLEKKEGGAMSIYIMTLGVLAPYRRLGIGETLAPVPPPARPRTNTEETNNEDAIAFYKKIRYKITM